MTLTKPAQPNEILVAYGTGIGGLSFSPATGSATPSNPQVTANVTPAITVGAEDATVQFAGLTPGSAGLAQFNFQMPASLPPDSTLPLVVNFSGAASPPVSLPVGKATASVQISFTPNPVTQSSGTDSCGANTASCWNYTVQLQETTGVGVTLTKMTISGTDYSDQIVAFLGSRRIAPGGELSGGIEATCDSCALPYADAWVFEGTDDNGHSFTVSSTVILTAAQSNKAGHAAPRSRILVPNR